MSWTPSNGKIIFEGAGSALTERQQTDELVHLFSTTLHSLAADAAAVRQASSLAHCLGIHYSDGNGNEQVEERLWELDDMVKGLEEKVTALRQIVSEEKRSLAKFETTLQTEAEEQVAMLQQIMQAMEGQAASLSASSEPNSKPKIGLMNHQDDDYEATKEQDDDNRSTSSDASSSSQTNLRLSPRRRGSSRRDSVDPRRSKSAPRGSAPEEAEENQDPLISLPRISAEELENYKSQNPMGPRISTSLMDLNEALDEIEQVCQRQRHAVLALKRKQQQQLLQHGTSGTLQRRYNYLQKRQQQQHGTSAVMSLEEPSEEEPVTITEQELRESCPFFRHGESTARATLSLLCRLRRLKQVPNKNGEVTYHLIL